MHYEIQMILVAGGLNLVLLGLVICGWHLRAQRRARLFELQHQERLLAMEKGIPLPELAPVEDSRAWPDRVVSYDPRWALIGGTISLFLAVGFIAMCLAIGGDDAKKFWPIGLMPLMLGAGLLLLYKLLRHDRK